MSDLKKIRTSLSHDEQILTITLNAPKANVLDKQMMNEIIHVLSNEANEPPIKAIIFAGEGDHFSFGASVHEHQKEFVNDMLKTFHKMLRTLIKTGKPMFALVRGQCLGGGLELASFCQWIFASPNAMFGQPEINLAVFPPVASLILPYRIGQTHADDLILSGRSITAAEAREIGLVHTISDDPEWKLNEFITKYILPKSRTALEFTVNAARFEMYQSFLKNIDVVETRYVQELMETEDANEGITAFLEKRKPVWQNG